MADRSTHPGVPLLVVALAAGILGALWAILGEGARTPARTDTRRDAIDEGAGGRPGRAAVQPPTRSAVRIPPASPSDPGGDPDHTTILAVSEDGGPVPGALLGHARQPGGLLDLSMDSPQAIGVTDEEGRLEFEGTPFATGAWLAATRPGWMPVLAFVENAKGLLEVVFYRPRLFTLEVVDDSGAPVPEAMVQVTAPWGREAARSGPGGLESFVGLLHQQRRTDGTGRADFALSPSKAYCASVVSRGHETLRRELLPEEIDAGHLQVRLAQVLVAGIAIQDPATSKLSRRSLGVLDFSVAWRGLKSVSFGRDGESLAHLRQQMAQQTGVDEAVWLFARRRAGGDVPPTAQLTIQDSGSGGQRTETLPFLPLSQIRRDDLLLVEAQEPDEDLCEVSITFRDQEGRAADPSSEEWWLVPEVGGRAIRPQGRDGRYRCLVPPGDYRISPRFEVGSSPNLMPRSVSCPRSGTVRVDVPLHEDIGAIVATAEGADGAPLAVWDVVLSAAEGGRSTVLLSDDGVVQAASLAPGTYHLAGGAYGYEAAFCKVEVHAGQEVEIHLVLPVLGSPIGHRRRSR